MSVKVSLAALVLAALPTFALAYCDEARMKPDGTMCPPDKLYDSEFALCVEKPTA